MDRTTQVIGFVSGCFDWLAPGHVRLFKAARRECDVLHLLMADDATVRHYKGRQRPLLCYAERYELVSACRYIDAIWELQKTPEISNQFALIQRIQPNIYFEGKDATDTEIQPYLSALGIKRVTLDTPELHVSDILERHFSQFAGEDHQALWKVAGL